MKKGSAVSVGVGRSAQAEYPSWPGASGVPNASRWVFSLEGRPGAEVINVRDDWGPKCSEGPIRAAMGSNF
jgi:hypothetical protein